jgi:exonuclease III
MRAPRALGPQSNMIVRGHARALLFFLLLASVLTNSRCALVVDKSVSMDNNLEFPFPLTVSSINCNSLNMSSTGTFNHKLKMYGITKLRTDIILLCDIRLSNSQNVPQSRDAILTFRTNPYGAYNFFYNSSQNKRAVGILLRKNGNFTVLEEHRDQEENILLLRLRHEGNNTEFYVGSIYGPNRHDPAFFNNLRHHLRNVNDTPVILGGDWNCTGSAEPVRSNPDVLNMHSIPNKRHSEYVQTLCDDLLLSDPYRVKFPNKKEYSFTPSDPTKKNRSRIDFFLISRSILRSVSEVNICAGLQNKLFDHHAIKLVLCKRSNPITPPTISKMILKDSETELVGGLAVADTYLIYSTALTVEERDRLLIGSGSAWRELREAGPSNNFAVPGDRTEIE